MNRNLKTRANNGFTIVELIVVVTVIGLLAAIAVSAYNKVVNDAKVTKSLAFVNTLATAKALFVADPKTTPDDENASTPKKKASRAFYPELPDEIAWFDFRFLFRRSLFGHGLRTDATNGFRRTAAGWDSC